MSVYWLTLWSLLTCMATAPTPAVSTRVPCFQISTTGPRLDTCNSNIVIIMSLLSLSCHFCHYHVISVIIMSFLLLSCQYCQYHVITVLIISIPYCHYHDITVIITDTIVIIDPHVITVNCHCQHFHYWQNLA